jgi:hypothetical protein
MKRPGPRRAAKSKAFRIGRRLSTHMARNDIDFILAIYPS